MIEKNIDLIIRKSDKQLSKELNSLPRTQTVLNAGATASMLMRKKSTDSLNFGNILESHSQLASSTNGLYFERMRNSKFTGIFDIVKLKRKFKKSNVEMAETERSSGENKKRMSNVVGSFLDKR